MNITRIEASNFKSLVHFRLPLAKFNCLIGLNGSGKSTVLQMIDFLSQLMQGNISAWLKDRKWKSKDVTSQLTVRALVEFSVLLEQDNGSSGSWHGRFNTRQKHCTYEKLIIGGHELLVEEGRYRIYRVCDTGARNAPSCDERVSFTYEGSILSQLKEDVLPGPLRAVKQFFRNVESLDLLSPELLRQRTRESAGSLGLGGERLSAFLHELGQEKRNHLKSRLKEVYPQLENLHVKSLRSGWKQLEVTESYQGKGTSGFFPRMTTEARHVNDGMLRLIAILSQLETERRFLLFDEIENGINPELIEFLLDTLVNCEQQVLVTTHSPMILNYLDDEVAKEGVIYLYKTPEGETRSIPFFSIPSLAEKLTVMGPGEAFVDTDLTDLHKEIETVTEYQ